MKKTLKSIIISFLLTVIVISSIGCSIFNSNTPPESDAPYDKVTIIYPNSEEIVTLYSGVSENITPKYIENKVLVGYYAQDSATGFEYFNFLGEMNGEWRKNNPTTLYAVYQDIDINDTYTSSIVQDEDPYRLVRATHTYDKEFKNPSKLDSFYALMFCNSNIDVICTFHMDLRHNGADTGEITVKFGFGSETLVSKTFNTSSSFSHYTLTATVKAKQILKNEIWISYSAFPGTLNQYGLVKNLYYKLSIQEQ